MLRINEDRIQKKVLNIKQKGKCLKGRQTAENRNNRLGNIMHSRNVECGMNWRRRKNRSCGTTETDRLGCKRIYIK
jgi:hypothetical protein